MVAASLKAQVLAAVKWTVLGRLATQLGSWVITILVMRHLVPDDYGLIAMAAMFSGLFAVVAEVGMGSSVIQSKDVSPRQMRQVFAVVLLSNLGIFVVLAAVVAPLAAWFFDEPRLTSVIRIVALAFVPAAFAVLPNALLDREMAFRGRAAIDFVAQLSGAILTLVLAYAGYGAWSLAWGPVLGALLRTAGLNWLKPYWVPPLFDLTGSGHLLRFGGNVAANRLVYYLYSQADSLIVGKLLGSHLLGLYSVAMNLASMPASRIATTLDQVAFPALSKVKRDGGDAKHYILMTVSGISIIAFPVLWGMSSVAPEIVNVLLGEKWQAATTSLALLALIMPLRILGPIFHAGLQSIGHADVSFRNTCTTAIAMCIAFVIGCRFGLLGVALAWVSVFPSAFVVNMMRSARYLNLTLGDILGALSRPALAAVLMYGAVVLGRKFILLPQQPLLFVLVTVGGATYALASLVLNKHGLTAALRILRPQPN